jgi:hypothetical protein
VVKCGQGGPTGVKRDQKGSGQDGLGRVKQGLMGNMVSGFKCGWLIGWVKG